MSQLKEFEGNKLCAYADPLTGAAPWTDGNGHCGPEVKPDTVISQAMADDQLQLDFNKAWQECVDLCEPWFTALCEPRQAVLVNIAFEAGDGTLLDFAPTRALIRDGRYDDAANHIRTSPLYREAKIRWARLARQMETGEWN